MRSRLLPGVGLLTALVLFSSFVAPPVQAKQPVKGIGKSDLRKYDDVITKDYATFPGVFAVHRLDEKLYFEIPQDKLGRLFLRQAEVAKGPRRGLFRRWGGAALGHAGGTLA